MTKNEASPTRARTVIAAAIVALALVAFALASTALLPAASGAPLDGPVLVETTTGDEDQPCLVVSTVPPDAEVGECATHVPTTTERPCVKFSTDPPGAEAGWCKSGNTS